jgi:hypothetical protein
MVLANVETVGGNIYIKLQNKDDYRNMASLDGTRKLYTAVKTSEYVYTECAAKHFAEQSVCTTLDDSLTQFCSDPKVSEKEVALIFFNWTLLFDNY